MTPDHDTGHTLHQIRTAKNRLIVCFLTFPLYVWAVMELLNQGNDITTLMLLYMLLYAGFGINCSIKRCPNCRGQFFVRKYFLNIFTKQCFHCGLSYDAEA